MKAYLHGPNAGKTILIKDYQFVNGEIEIASIPVYLSRYYNVKDHPPESTKVIDISVKVEEEKQEDSELEDAYKIVHPEGESDGVQKAEEEIDWKSMKWFAMAQHVQKVTGVRPKNKEHAMDLMGE